MTSGTIKQGKNSAVSVAYDAVAALYPTQVVTPSSPAFSETRNSFWNAFQRENIPACLFQPTCPDQVARAIIEIVRAQCPFAIKGGGHSSNPRGSSIHAGFQLDLSKLNHVEIAGDKQSVRVGPGMRWGDVFRILEKHGVTTVGGRDSSVGVSGFIFGGGLSYHSTQYGWGIDNLISADIVLANGELITVNKVSYPDLNRALRGGGAHNFGIITDMTLKLYSLQGMWGGLYAIAEEHFEALFEAYDNYTKNLVRDGKAHMIIDFYWQDGIVTAAHFMGYPEPLADPPIYDEIRRIPSVANTLRLANYSNLTDEMTQVTDASGLRSSWWTFSMDYDISLLKAVYSLWREMTEPYARRFRFAFDVNHLPPSLRNNARREGQDNMYGLEGPDEPLTNILLTSAWENRSNDDEVKSLLRELGMSLERVTREWGKARSFKYMNYAHEQQDVIAGLGEDNKMFLKEVSKKYDPEGVFQRLQRGGFKLDGPKLDVSHARI